MTLTAQPPRTRRRKPVVTSTVHVERRSNHVPEYACRVEGVWTVDGVACRLLVLLGQAKVDSAVVRSVAARERGEDPEALACEFYDIIAVPVEVS